MPVKISQVSLLETLKSSPSRASRVQRQSDAKRLAKLEARSPVRRSNLRSDISVTFLPIADLKPRSAKLRKLDEANILEMMNAISDTNLFCSPIIVGPKNRILDGEVRLEAARRLGLITIPCIRLDDIDETQERKLRIGLNRIGQNRAWDLDVLKGEIEALLADNQSVEFVGFSRIEIDQLMGPNNSVGTEESQLAADPDAVAINRKGYCWQLGTHRLLCGDATQALSYEALLQGKRPQLMITDPPYNVVIGKTVSTKHREFVEGSGEKSAQEFADFLRIFLEIAQAHLKDGALALVFMDWRSITSLILAGQTAGFELVNLICWIKNSGGMGSLWRSQHELVAAFRKPGQHKNNVQLGKNGRDRTNCWFAAGANTVGSDARTLLKDHPTPKPVDLLVEALLDVTDRGDIVLDPFGGSGSTLIAAERVGRHARIMELDPLYCDLIIRRWSKISGIQAIHVESGKTFAEMELEQQALTERPVVQQAPHVRRK